MLTRAVTQHFTRIVSVLALTIALAQPTNSDAGGPRVLPPGELPRDVRLGPLKDLNGYFPFTVPQERDDWMARAAELKLQVLVSQGLWPMPTRSTRPPVIHGRIEMDDYTIDKVYFESMPGFYVTGNLYRPTKVDGKLPGVLCPHGHWANGRFYDCGAAAVRKQIVQGAERFEDGGRSPMQSRCVQLARMGCVVFHYDMIGYADSRQISQEIIHGFRKQRPEMNDPARWGLYSPQAESRLQSSMGLQTFNSICSLDFLLSLADVDPDRIAVTGASGGGTQTFVLAGIDPRVSVAFPAVMVSTAMQGGCTCENSCCLRVGTGNIELAALFAPKPLGMTAANDWTHEMESKGFPELQQLYKMLGRPNNVALTPLVHFGHNYNYVSRAAMYSWLNDHLKLGFQDPIVEEGYQRLDAAQLTVWDDEHPQPKGGAEMERKLLAWWNQDSMAQLDALLPKNAASCEAYQDVIGKGIGAIIARRLPDAERLDLKIVAEEQRSGYRSVTGLLTYTLPARLASASNQEGKVDGIQEQLPVILMSGAAPSKRVCVMAMPKGKAGLFDDAGSPLLPVRRLLDAGFTVVAADLLYQGEFLKDGKPITRTRRVENPREAAAYTFGYNPTLFAHRVHDVLSVIAMCGLEPLAADQVDLVGIGEGGPWAAVAAAQSGKRVARLAVDHADFRFATIEDLHSPSFLPGGAKYHDLPGILALFAPKPLWLAGDTRVPEPVKAMYQALGQEERITRCEEALTERLPAAVDWLLK